MVTMLKEKVNTHFSFPMRLDMSGYVEQKLMPHRSQGKDYCVMNLAKYFLRLIVYINFSLLINNS